ncbi:MAG: TRAP transporter large permease [Deltaproteobacteria bacterium]|nr:TRAP transporter large permease [Deltaproteobacteria bacterium]
MEYIIGPLVIVMVLINVPIGFALAITTVILMAIKGIGLLAVPLRLFHGVDNFPLIAIPLFILAGQLMNSAGLSVRLINFCSALVGFIRGGLAMVNIVASMFFAEISGSAVADAAALGSILIPAMRRKGYPADFSAAVTSASATQAIIIPPSIPMIIYAVMAETSIVALFMAGLIPGVIAGISMMILSYYFAVKKKYPIEEVFNLRKLWVTFKEAAWTFLLPVIIIGGILGGVFTATEAASMAVMAAFFIGVFVYRELRLRDLPQVLLNCGIQSAVVMMIVAGSALLSWLLTNELIPQRIAAAMMAATENKYIILMLMNVFFLFAGMFLHSAAAIIMIVPIVMPLVHKVGIDPIHFGLIVTFNLGIGQQTPPVASVLLTTCSVANVSISEVMRVNIYFIFLAIGVLIILTYLPEISLFLPTLLGLR